MWDGRESFKGQTLNFNLSDQAVGATLGHAQASQAPTSQQVAEIVSFELSNFTAQIDDDRVGELNAEGAQGGPNALASSSLSRLESTIRSAEHLLALISTPWP